MYVKWNSTKFHVLGEYSGLTSFEGGEKQVSGMSYGGEVHPARTLCGAEIPADNQCLDRLPEGDDPYKTVCHKCSLGVGVPKIDHVAEQTRHDEQIKAVSDKIRKRRKDSARQLFD